MKFIKFNNKLINFDLIWKVEARPGERGVGIYPIQDYQICDWEDCGSLEAAQARLDELLAILNAPEHQVKPKSGYTPILPSVLPDKRADCDSSLIACRNHVHVDDE